MNKIDNKQLISNRRYCFDTFSMDPLLLEDELVKHDIEFVKNYISTRQSSVVYSFFEKDIEFVNSILNDIEKKSLECVDKKKKITRKKKNTPEVMRKKTAISILVIISIVILFSIIL